ncbi:DUF6647 family protein [Pseudorhodoplanes sinuspersici]|uniref:DUF6647 domain-containing protein n=1 Tax=Pseudorhodoplanes sinuspersici TaxID=1235591 RepID=A0A1W6ZS09_9HYPH|nr:DUF6647 family protein [Pseudorhodoplanes sinuspersici]ARQ00068.1 hypothetical protein CAK95_13985 [Pseudorhodoplanes sinuspersici]RKE71110.1 hypothetical protein DFP91_3367 [Pseudorhodoplanes sinuspersici]
MDSLLAMIALWLSFNFGLPAISEPPKVEVVSAQEILFKRYRAFTPQAQQALLATVGGNDTNGKSRKAVAIYDEPTGTIFLTEGWNSKNPADLSVLVHEMVHHVQREGGLRYECPAAREELAYAAQDKWLNMFGRNLFDDFDLDAFTLRVSTSCGL